MLDTHLKLLADASLELEAAEEAVQDGAHHTATERLDVVAAALEELRTRWPEMSPPERAVVGPSAAELRNRCDAARARIPKLTALSVGAPEADPEQDEAPLE